MKILLTTHQFLPNYIGGTEALVLEVSQEYLRRGHAVRILSGWPVPSAFDNESDDEFSHCGVQVSRVYPPLSVTASASQYVQHDTEHPAALRVFENLLSSWRPDIVHAFHLHRLSAAISKASTLAGVPIFYTPTDFWAACPLGQLRLPDGRTCHGPDEDAINCIAHVAIVGRRAYLAPVHRWMPRRTLGHVLRLLPDADHAKSSALKAARALQRRPAAMRAMLRSFDRITAPTRTMADRMVAAGADPARIREVRYGLDVVPFRDMTPIAAGTTLKVGFIGALQPHKGAHVLVEAVRRLPTDAALAVSIHGDVGADPAYVDRLRSLVAHDSRIAFEGTFAPHDIARVLEGIDVLVVPSVWDENAPLVLLAAQAARRPVIGSNVPGIAEAVNADRSGWLFERGDAAALASILATLVADRGPLIEVASTMSASRTIGDYVDDLIAVYRMSPSPADVADDGAAPVRCGSPESVEVSG